MGMLSNARILCFMIVLSVVFQSSLHAEDRNDSYPVEVRAQTYDSQLCVDTRTNICVVERCQTSEERDCQDTCAQNARAVCETKGYHTVYPYE